MCDFPGSRSRRGHAATAPPERGVLSFRATPLLCLAASPGAGRLHLASTVDAVDILRRRSPDELGRTPC